MVQITEEEVYLTLFSTQSILFFKFITCGTWGKAAQNRTLREPIPKMGTYTARVVISGASIL